MECGNASDVTIIINAIGEGDEGAEIKLIDLVYKELHRIAEPMMRGQPSGHTLQATALVHESFLRLLRGDTLKNPRSRGYFFGAAARAMRQVLVDHARKKKAIKRGGDMVRQSLDMAVDDLAVDQLDIIALDDALLKLAKIDKKKHDILSLRFFGGLTHTEIAACMDISLRSVEDGFRAAKKWLRVVIGV